MQSLCNIDRVSRESPELQRLCGQPNALLDSLLPRLGSHVDYQYLTYSNYHWDVTYLVPASGLLVSGCHLWLPLQTLVLRARSADCVRALAGLPVLGRFH